MDTHTWKEIYLLAISEQENGRLPQRIRDARGAIFDRIEDRIMRPDNDERRMLNDALDALQTLQRKFERQVHKKAS